PGHHHNVGLVGALGLSFHSFLDGLAIGVAFEAGPRTGFVVLLAVVAHDFADGLDTVTIMLARTNIPIRTGALLLVDAIASVAGARLMTEKDLFSFRWIADPQLSPEGSQIAFVRVTVDEKKDRYDTSIWSVPARGGDPRELTAGPSDSAPRWSPDGQSLAFLRSVEKDAKPPPAQSYMLPLNGGEPRAVTP